MNAEPIVVGVDGSAKSIYALRWAAEESERLDLPVHAVLAVSSSGEPPAGEQSDRLLNITIDTALPPTHGRSRSQVTPYVVAGNPVEVLTGRSHGAALLVLGRSPGVDPLHTSTMAQCLRRAACPVAVVPASAPGPGTPGDPVRPKAVAQDAGLSKRPVGTVMQRQLLGVTTAAGVDTALQLMVGARIHHLPVTEHGRCVGLLHESDLVWRMAAWPFNESPPVADDIARKPPPVVSYDQTVGEAAAAMFYGDSDAVLVTDGQSVVGILTTNDLLALLARPGEREDQS